MRAKVLITGGAGFIGIHVARRLLQSSHQVTILDNFSPQIHGDVTDLPEDLRGHVRLIRGDVRDPESWENVLIDCEVVLNLAAETGTGQSMYEVSRYEQVNLAGTANLYQVLASKPQRSGGKDRCRFFSRHLRRGCLSMSERWIGLSSVEIHRRQVGRPIRPALSGV